MVEGSNPSRVAPIMTELRNEPLVKLRGMAQAFGITDIFEKDAVHLAQEIELKQQKMVEPEIPLPPKPEYDARLMTKPPSRRSSAVEITELLAEHIKRGLKLSFTEEQWYMACGIKNDQGTIRMPLRHVMECANKVMR